MKKEIKHNKKQESGQIIVILALSLVVVMVVAALAVDGGMIYSERRFAQNTADASAMAGGGALVYSGELSDDMECPTSALYNPTSGKFTHNAGVNIVEAAYVAARNVAQINNVNDLPFLGYIVRDKDGDVTVQQSYGDGIDADHGVVIECNSEVIPTIIDTKVKITSQISTAFAHLIFPGALVTTNEAISRVEPFTTVFGGYALVALSEDCKTGQIEPAWLDYMWKIDDANPVVPAYIGGMRFDGLQYDKGRVVIKNGRIHTNSCYQLNGDGTPDSIVVDASGMITSENDTALMSPPGLWLTPEQANPYDFDFSVGDADAMPYPPEPTCTGAGSYSKVTEGGETTYYYTSGNYSNGILIDGGQKKVVFQSGNYCVRGDLIIKAKGTVVGEGVTFFVQKSTDNPGDTPALVRFEGARTVLMTAPVEGTYTDPDSGEEKPKFGYLIFMDDDNVKKDISGNITQRGLISMVGNNSSFFAGTVLAYTGALDIGGSDQTGVNLCELVYDDDADISRCEGVNFSSQFIGYFVQIRGSAIVEILYNDETTPREGGNFYLLK